MIINHDDAYFVSIELNKNEIEELLHGKGQWMYTWNGEKKVAVHIYNCERCCKE